MQAKKKALIKTVAPANVPLSALQKKQIKDMMLAQTEVKAFAYTTGTVNPGGTGNVYALTRVVQGVTDNNRIGDNLVKKELMVMYTITVGATGLVAAADQYNTVRVILFTWHEDDGGFNPTQALILDDVGVTPTTVAHYLYDTAFTYKILYDKSHVVFNTPVWNGSALTWTHGVGGTYQTPEPIRVPLKGKIDFASNTNFGRGHVYALILSDSAFSPNPSVVLTSRLLFTDA